MTREQKLKTQKEFSQKFKSCLTLSIGLVLLLSLVRMIVYNKTSTFGSGLEKTKQEIVEIQKENLYLKSLLAQKTGGLDEIEKLAQEQGYSNKINIKYFNTSVSVAQVLP